MPKNKLTLDDCWDLDALQGHANETRIVEPKTSPERDRYVREIILEAAAEVTCGEKEEDYGSPAAHFALVARLWSITLGTEVKAWQVAVCMGQVKDARIMHNPRHWDSWVDKAGYTGLGAELAMRPNWLDQEGDN